MGEAGAWQAVLKLSPLPGSSPVCSPQQYKDCANPALGKEQASLHPVPTPLGRGCQPRREAGPDPGDCAPQTPCCGRTRALAPTLAQARATPRSSPWCACRVALPPATWPGNTTAARPTSCELARPRAGTQTEPGQGKGRAPSSRPGLLEHSGVGHRSARRHQALGFWTSCLPFPMLSSANGLVKGVTENEHLSPASSWHQGVSREHSRLFYPPGRMCWCWTSSLRPSTTRR